MKKIIKIIVITSMIIVLLRIKFKFFLHTTRCNTKRIIRKTVSKLTNVKNNQTKNTIKVMNIEVE